MGREVHARHRHDECEPDRQPLPAVASLARREEREDQGDGGRRARDRVTGREREPDGRHQGGRRAAAVEPRLQHVEDHLAAGPGRGEREAPGPAPTDREHEDGGDPDRDRDDAAADHVQHLADPRERSVPNVEHPAAHRGVEPADEADRRQRSDLGWVTAHQEERRAAAGQQGERPEERASVVCEHLRFRSHPGSSHGGGPVIGEVVGGREEPDGAEEYARIGRTPSLPAFPTTHRALRTRR